MNQKEKAKRFAQLHVKGAPLLLYNAWDAGSAQSVLEAGAKAIATSSWSVAAAQGYQDGEAIPIEFAEQIVGRIATSVDAPVTVDFEGGYSEDDNELADNVSRLIDLGVIGVNFEDRVVKAQGFIASTDKLGGSVLSAKRQSRSASTSSSTRDPTYFLSTVRTQPKQLTKR
jgi:2-methylisocitrate lyase-like PEP mutase family enzyme